MVCPPCGMVESCHTPSARMKYLIPILLLVLLCKSASPAGALPGTAPLNDQKDFAAEMVQGIDRFLMDKTKRSIDRRQTMWSRDFSSPQRYEQSVALNRQHLARMLGVVDAREGVEAIEFITTTDEPALIGRAGDVKIYAVRWPVVGPIHAEGLMLVPGGKILADVVGVPDADQTPEMICGLSPGVPP